MVGIFGALLRWMTFLDFGGFVVRKRLRRSDNSDGFTGMLERGERGRWKKSRIVTHWVGTFEREDLNFGFILHPLAEFRALSP